jgi:ABC-type iron transport system FetAB ATPase subunit
MCPHRPSVRAVSPPIRQEPSLSRLRIAQVRTPVLGPVDLEVAGGECVVLAGASGSGKTLLLRAIADLDPHGGEVYLDGRPARAFRPPEWRRRVALLPAESQWWYETVGPHFPTFDAALFEALGFAREVLDWDVGRLSTGERQRLALLRILSNRPAVLLLDEPTAALDPANVKRTEALLHEYRLQHNAALLWVSHDPQQIRRVADRYYRIERGVLTEQDRSRWALAR